MSGVVVNGVRYERCNQCAGWTRYDEMYYLPLNPTLPMPKWAEGLNDIDKVKCDICPKCVSGVSWAGAVRDE